MFAQFVRFRVQPRNSSHALSRYYSRRGGTKGTATRINDHGFKGKLIRTSRVTRAPHQPAIRRDSFSAGNDVSRVEMGLNHREEDTYLPRRVSRTGCNGAIITRRTIVCVG